MKKIFALVVCLVMLTSSCLAGNAESNSLVIQNMSLDDFVEAYTGKTISFDACIDLYKNQRGRLDLRPGNFEDDYKGDLSFRIDGIEFDRTLKNGDNVYVTAKVIGKMKSMVAKKIMVRLEPISIVGRPTKDAPYIDRDLLIASGYSNDRADYTIESLQDGSKERSDIKLDEVAVKDQYQAYLDEHPEDSPIDFDTEKQEETTNDDTYSTLEKGSKGDDVQSLQQRLIDLHYLNDKADGSYGNKTKAAVEKFQRTVGFEVTGIADPVTQAALFGDDAPEASLSVSQASIVIGSMAKTVWNVEGQEFTLTGKQTKKISTAFGTYKFDAFGNYEKID